MPIYGYGAKAFTLSMVETLLRITKGEASAGLVQEVIGLGKGLLQTPVKVLDGVTDVLVRLNGKLLKGINCKPENFLMVGNSLKSDVMPVLELGGYAVHVPYHVTWTWETIDQKIENPRFLEAQNIREVLNHL